MQQKVEQGDGQRLIVAMVQPLRNYTFLEPIVTGITRASLRKDPLNVGASCET
jgi:hypothetical protein